MVWPVPSMLFGVPLVPERIPGARRWCGDTEEAFVVVVEYETPRSPSARWLVAIDVFSGPGAVRKLRAVGETYEAALSELRARLN